MFRMLADENFNGSIVRGLVLRQQGLDLVRVQDTGLAGADDSIILAWAADNDRIVLTHDRATMPNAAYSRMISKLPFAGLFVTNDRLAVVRAIQELVLIADCSQQLDWKNRVVFLPL